jgi:uncharacterized membrane protein YgaE (UPF0421/DUF939 family)
VQGGAHVGEAADREHAVAGKPDDRSGRADLRERVARVSQHGVVVEVDVQGRRLVADWMVIVDELISDCQAPGMPQVISPRIQRLRETAKPIGSSALAAALAWLIARDMAGHSAPFFAPVAALMVSGLTVGQRALRAVELTVGQALGILSADLLVTQIGKGSAQIGLVVGIAMAVAVLLGPGALLAQQAAISGVLVVVLQPPGSGLSGARFVDALIGGGVALILNTVVFPTNPLQHVRRRGLPLLGQLAQTLEQIAEALQSMDRGVADAALAHARALDLLAGRLTEAVGASREVASLSPRRRSARGAVATQQAVAGQLDFAVRNTRVLARRARRAVEQQEPIPSSLIDAVLALAEVVRGLDLCAATPERVAGRELALHAAACANASLHCNRSLSVTVLIAQVRSLVQDLLIAVGLEEEDAMAAIDAA